MEPGWIIADATISNTGGFIYAPIITCPLEQGPDFTLFGEGQELGMNSRARIELSFPGYTGAGKYSELVPDALDVSVYQNEIGTYTTTSTTQCEVCVEPGERSGIFRCVNLAYGEYPMHVFAAAFFCQP
jgi:hypothetical protein